MYGFAFGERVVYVGPLPSLSGRAGRLVGWRNKAHGSLVTDKMGDIIFDHDSNRTRVVELKNLVSEKEYNMSKLTNFKVTVQTAIANLLKPLDADSAKEQAVRRLGVAAEITKLGEADKKKAKTELTKLGIITGEPQFGVVFDSARYTMTASTIAASKRLDGQALATALTNEGISYAKAQRIIDAAMVESKAPVSFTVEVK